MQTGRLEMMFCRWPLMGAMDNKAKTVPTHPPSSTIYFLKKGSLREFECVLYRLGRDQKRIHMQSEKGLILERAG